MYNISKYHGCGNNFVIMQEAELTEQLGVPCGEESAGAYAKFAARVCDESVGVGADGFIIVRTEPVLEMVFFNRDGSRAPMCGNGIRCFAHYCRDHKIRTGDAYPVKTLAGDMVVEVKAPIRSGRRSTWDARYLTRQPYVLNPMRRICWNWNFL